MPMNGPTALQSGRLGLDPYDPDGPALTPFSKGISPDLFGDVCEAARIDELSDISRWTRENEKRLRKVPKVPIKNYGSPPRIDISVKPWEEGYKAAAELRKILGLTREKPPRTVEILLHGALDDDQCVLPAGPSAIEALTRRVSDHMQIGVKKGLRDSVAFMLAARRIWRGIARWAKKLRLRLLKPEDSNQVVRSPRSYWHQLIFCVSERATMDLPQTTSLQLQTNSNARSGC